MMDPVRPWPPEAGYYATRLVRGGPRVAVRIWFGPPIIDGEEQDRSPRWCAEIDGEPDREEWAGDRASRHCIGRVPRDASEVWPFCAKEPIDQAEYEFLKARATHAKEWQPNHPAATPRKKMDLRAMPSIF